MGTDATYPQREKFFALRFTRLLTKCCVANELGALGAWMLTVIVHQEDAAHYRRGVSFYDGQLMPLLGINSKWTMTSVRKKLVAAGWLHFDSGHKGKASTYWVVIPSHALSLDDQPTDEGFDNDSVQKMNRTGEAVQNMNRNQIESFIHTEPNPGHYIPIPHPHPHPTEGGAGEVTESKSDRAFPRQPDPLRQLFPHTLISSQLPGYTGGVVQDAWDVARLFAERNPDRRSYEVATKIVKRYADCISSNGPTATVKLKTYYALTDPVKWQVEVDAGSRLPVGASPWDVCCKLFPRSSKPNDGPPPAPLPEATDFFDAKQAEFEALKKAEQGRGEVVSV